MDEILNQLGKLLVRALPTFVLVILLHFYLKHFFYRPLDKALERRREATQGAREAARLTLEKAEKLASEYELALQRARAEVYQHQEETRKMWRAEQAVALDQARRKASEMVKAARAQLASEVEQAKLVLAGEAERLAVAIAESILRGTRA